MRRLMRIKTGLIVLFILLFLLKPAVQWALLPMIMAGAALLVFCISIRDLKSLTRNMIALLLLGSAVLIGAGPGHFDWAQAVIANSGIAALLMTAPMMGIILYYAPYETIIASLANQYIRTNSQFYALTMVLVTLLCPVMNLAAVPFTYQLLSPIAAKYRLAVFHRALIMGFCANVFWAPNLGSMAIVLQYVPIAWQELAPIGMGFAVLAFAVAGVEVFHTISSGKGHATAPASHVETGSPVPVGPENWRYLIILVIQVGLNLAALTGLTNYAGLNIYVAVTAVAISMPFLSALALDKIGIYRHRLKFYLTHSLPGMSNEFVLFLSIGFFGQALAQSPAVAVVQAQIANIGGYSPPVLVLIIIVTIAGMSMTGIHPMITISAFTIALGNLELSLSNVELAIALLAGYILYLCISPFSSLVMIMAGLSRQDVYSMGLHLNARYAIYLSVLVTAVFYVWKS